MRLSLQGDVAYVSTPLVAARTGEVDHELV